MNNEWDSISFQHPIKKKTEHDTKIGEEQYSINMFYLKNYKWNSNIFSMMTMVMVIFICNKIDGVVSDIPRKSWTQNTTI